MKFEKDTRVLLIYPNLSMSFCLPHSIAYLSSSLKQIGCRVRLFDTTLYKPKHSMSDDDIRVSLGQFPHVDVPGVKQSDMIQDFEAIVDDFKPDCVMVSFVDNTIELGMKLLEHVPNNIPIVAGGIAVIVNPQYFINSSFISDICISSAHDFFNVKKGFEDFTIFEKERFYRPFSGKLYKTIPWHTNVCPYNCGFCCASYLRKHSGYDDFDFDRCLKELVFQIELHNPEFIHITSESFLSMSLKDLEKFQNVYRDYNIPFWCQSNINDISKEKMKILKELNCFKIALGIECGNEEYRKMVINKHFTNKKAIEAIKIISSNNIRIGLNNIIGFPFETKDMINETITLNKKMYYIATGNGCPEVQVNCYIFQPYHGTTLREFCKKHNLLRSNRVSQVNQGEIVVNNPFVSDKYLYMVEKNFVRTVKWMKD